MSKAAARSIRNNRDLFDAILEGNLTRPDQGMVEDERKIPGHVRARLHLLEARDLSGNYRRSIIAAG
jgi:hypothetical protein